jgi:hypothetical protein
MTARFTPCEGHVDLAHGTDRKTVGGGPKHHAAVGIWVVGVPQVVTYSSSRSGQPTAKLVGAAFVVAALRRRICAPLCVNTSAEIHCCTEHFNALTAAHRAAVARWSPSDRLAH